MRNQLPIFSFAVVLLMLGFMPEAWQEYLEFHYGSAPSWRWFTAHFIHLGMNHLLMNVAGAIVVWFLAVMYVPRVLLVLLLISLPWAISFGLYMLGAPDNIVGYRGFSGAIYGFMIAGVVYLYPRDKVVALGLLFFIVVKVVMEQLALFDTMPMESFINGVVEVNAHLFGAIFGLLLTAGYCFLTIRVASERIKKPESIR